MKLSKENAAALAELREYLSPRLSELYFRLIAAAVECPTVTPKLQLEAGQLILQIGMKQKGPAIPRGTLYWGLYRLVEIGLITVDTTRRQTIVTVLNFAFPKKPAVLIQTPPPPPTRKKPALKHFPDTDPAMRLAKTLHQFMALRLPTLKEPNLQAWAKDADLLLRLDGRPFEEADKVLRFSQKDPFWQTVILSPANLRDKYDRLHMRMINDAATPQNPAKRTTIPSAAERDHERLQANIKRFS